MRDEHTVGDPVVLVDDHQVREALGHGLVDRLLDGSVASPDGLRVGDDARELLHEGNRSLQEPIFFKLEKVTVGRMSM